MLGGEGGLVGKRKHLALFVGNMSEKIEKILKILLYYFLLFSAHNSAPMLLTQTTWHLIILKYCQIYKFFNNLLSKFQNLTNMATSHKNCDI